MRRPLRIAVFTVIDYGLDAIINAIHQRGDTLAVVVTCPGAFSNFDNSYRQVVNNVPLDVDLIVSNQHKLYASKLACYSIDAIVSINFPFKLSDDLLALPPLGAINLHNSALPLYRGINAYGWTSISNARELNFCIHRMNQNFNGGNILVEESLSWPVNHGLKELRQLAPALWTRMFSHALNQLEAGERGTVQQGEASIAPIFPQAFRQVHLSQPALEIHNRCRSFYGVKGSPKGIICHLNGKQICITETFYDPCLDALFKKNPAGTILLQEKERLVVQCGDIPLEIKSWYPTGVPIEDKADLEEALKN